MTGQSTDDLLRKFLRISTDLLPTETKLGQILQSVAEGFRSDRCLLLRPDQLHPDGLFSRVASEKEALWVEDGTSFSKANVRPDEEPFLCATFVCLPLFEGGSFQGILYLGFSKPRHFLSEEVNLLSLIARGIGEVLRNAALHSKAEQTISEAGRLVQDHEKSLRQLSTLYELNKMLLTTVHLERTLQMILTAITHGEGLGFNRAMLFLVDEKDRVLRGTMAVGPDSPEEAGRIWKALAQKKGSPSEIIPQLDPPEKPSQLDLLVKEIVIPLEERQCILTRAILEGRSFNIQVSEKGRSQDGCEGLCRLSSEVGCIEARLLGRDPKSYVFATIPLWGKGRVIGVIVVDNLYNQNPIKDEDIQFLSMFANQAGLAIENALLYRTLEEVHQELKEAQARIVHQEKMAALGELSNTIAHEIKNPLTAIGGFARRLDRKIPFKSPEKRYTQPLIQEVARLEKVLDDINHYTHEDPMVYQPLDLFSILEDSLLSVTDALGPGKIQLIREYAEGVPRIMGDSRQLKQAFVNLIKNASESMRQKGTLSIRIFPFSKEGVSCVRLEVKDSGKGIDPEDLPNIFNPFYSTKESRLGLGLPIVHKIIASHRGQIEVDNRPREGVTFIILLPAFEEGVKNHNRHKKMDADGLPLV
jgi:two-component system, NtrC family, sensor histidine kinase HydH